MRTSIRLAILVAVVAATTSAFALHAASGARVTATDFRATFTETNASVTNRVADLGIFQLINTASGTVDGYGAATVVLAMSQDRSVAPCGPGSWTNAGTRRIVLDGGVLVLHEVAEVCETEIGLVATGNLDGRRNVEHRSVLRRLGKRTYRGLPAGATVDPHGDAEAAARGPVSGMLRLSAVVLLAAAATVGVGWTLTGSPQGAWPTTADRPPDRLRARSPSGSAAFPRTSRPRRTPSGSPRASVDSSASIRRRTGSWRGSARAAP